MTNYKGMSEEWGNHKREYKNVEVIAVPESSSLVMRRQSGVGSPASLR